MLRQIKLRNFKSFSQATVDLGRFTVMVGANASGKSNIFDAIRFLQGCAQDLTIAEVLRGRYEGGREIWQGIRGGIAEVAKGDLESFCIDSTWDWGKEKLEHHLCCSTADPVQVLEERLVGSNHGRYLFDTHADSLGTGAGLRPGGGIATALRRAGGGGRSPSIVYSSHRSVLGQIEPSLDIHADVLKGANFLTRSARQANFLNITPSQMRDYVPKQARQLGSLGENLSAVLWHLCQDDDRRIELVDWLSELVSPELRDISFVNTELDDVMLSVVEQSGHKISARSLSDGTLRFLGELAALWTAEEGSLLLVEEIENGLHPQRSKLLVELFERMTEERRIQVIATSHSPLILEGLSERSRNSAVLVGRSPDTQESKAIRLVDLPYFDTVFEAKGIEYMMRTGWLEQAL